MVSKVGLFLILFQFTNFASAKDSKIATDKARRPTSEAYSGCVKTTLNNLVSEVRFCEGSWSVIGTGSTAVVCCAPEDEKPAPAPGPSDGGGGR